MALTVPGVKKAKELRFAYKDVEGALRAVVIQVQHVQDGADRIEIQVSSDHAPVHIVTILPPSETARHRRPRL